MGRKNRNIKHLLIIRLSAMGDVAMVVHAVRALRMAYPDMRISMLSKELFKPLFDGLNVEFIAQDSAHRGLVGIKRLADEIATHDIDAVADLHNVLQTAVLRSFLRLKGIPSEHLFKGRISKWMRMDGGCQSMTAPLKHTVNRYCDVLRRLGLQFDDPKPSVKISRPNPITEDKGDEKWIGIAPFSAHEGKSYPRHLVREVVAQLSESYDRIFVHTGGGSELDFANEMAAKYQNVSIVFGTMRLVDEINLISHLDCIISMDSFAMHVASLVATPVVSIWGATHPSLGFSGYGCGEDGFVQLELPCRPCSTFGNKRCRFADYRCLNGIAPSIIIEKVKEII